MFKIVRQNKNKTDGDWQNWGTVKWAGPKGWIVLVRNHLDKEWCNPLALIHMTEGIGPESDEIIDGCMLIQYK